MKYKQRKKALILLEDGTIFYGKSIGKDGTSFGEVCFNTGTTGYQEIFTDPSYYGQLMVTTNAHIGNYGTKNFYDVAIILNKLYRNKKKVKIIKNKLETFSINKLDVKITKAKKLLNWKPNISLRRGLT